MMSKTTFLRALPRHLRLLRGNSTMSSSQVTSEETSKWAAKPWKITAAVSVERMPIVTPDLDPMQVKMNNFLQQLEMEQSLKCDHELRIEQDLELLEMKKRGEPIPADKLNVNTAEDDAEIWRKDAAMLQLASRKTEADEKNDTKSTNRKLDKSLFLVIKNEKNFWTLPMLDNVQGESLRNTADRALKNICGQDFNAQVLGNAPFAHAKVKYSKNYQEETGVRGQKIFFYKAFYKGSGKVPEKLEWLTKDEMSELLDPLLKKPLLSVLYSDD